MRGPVDADSSGIAERIHASAYHVFTFHVSLKESHVITNQTLVPERLEDLWVAA
jgi:hypothetical protein